MTYEAKDGAIYKDGERVPLGEIAERLNNPEVWVVQSLENDYFFRQKNDAKEFYDSFGIYGMAPPQRLVFDEDD